MFNLAMLARQGWRLIQDPDSLRGQILRAKYGSLLTAQEEPGISYTWRSIIRGFKALNKGLIWRVGDGSNIKIWDDPVRIDLPPVRPNGLTRPCPRALIGDAQPYMVGGSPSHCAIKRGGGRRLSSRGSP